MGTGVTIVVVTRPVPVEVVNSVETGLPLLKIVLTALVVVEVLVKVEVRVNEDCGGPPPMSAAELHAQCQFRSTNNQCETNVALAVVGDGPLPPAADEAVLAVGPTPPVPVAPLLLPPPWALVPLPFPALLEVTVDPELLGLPLAPLPDPPLPLLFPAVTGDVTTAPVDDGDAVPDAGTGADGEGAPGAGGGAGVSLTDPVDGGWSGFVPVLWVGEAGPTDLVLPRVGGAGETGVGTLGPLGDESAAVVVGTVVADDVVVVGEASAGDDAVVVGEAAAEDDTTVVDDAGGVKGVRGVDDARGEDDPSVVVDVDVVESPASLIWRGKLCTMAQK